LRATLFFRWQKIADEVAEVVDQASKAIALAVGMLIGAAAGGLFSPPVF
jgi:hypothetical protein